MAKVPPKHPKFDRRHPFKADGVNDPRVMKYISVDDGEHEERGGVTHLVQGWIQQNQPEKVRVPFKYRFHYSRESHVRQGLFLSSDCTHTSTAVMSMEPYYELTRPLAEHLAVMYKVLFPELYEKLKPAFDAGRWFKQDPGPWVGRALVYKLQVELHLDGNDVGPSVSFPCGDFSGGQMLVPQLEAKFRSVHFFLIFQQLLTLPSYLVVPSTPMTSISIQCIPPYIGG